MCDIFKLDSTSSAAVPVLWWSAPLKCHQSWTPPSLSL